MTSESEMFDAYASSVIEIAFEDRVAIVPDGVQPLGEDFRRVPSPFVGDGGWVITAWNPRSAGELSLEENRARNVELRHGLAEAGALVVDAVGRSRSGDMAEESFYCTGLDRGVLLGLAARFEQNAVFHLDVERVAVVGILIDDQRSIGYSVWTRVKPGSAGV